MKLAEVIQRALVTEKSVAGRAQSRYAFEVSRIASKAVIRQAVEEFFKVKVRSVRTISVAGKKRRFGQHQGVTPRWKKAIVTLSPGEKIELLET